MQRTAIGKAYSALRALKTCLCCIYLRTLFPSNDLHDVKPRTPMKDSRSFLASVPDLDPSPRTGAIPQDWVSIIDSNPETVVVRRRASNYSTYAEALVGIKTKFSSHMTFSSLIFHYLVRRLGRIFFSQKS